MSSVEDAAVDTLVIPGALNTSEVHLLFVMVLCATIVLVTKIQISRRQGRGAKATASPETAFRRFQLEYLSVYLLMTAGDWLQGPYMYALYAAYGYSHDQIAALFVAGFGSSCLFGTFVGSLADTLGRKRGALCYVVTYALSCLTKHWRSYAVLMVGRVLGGIATSLLFSVFEAWLVSEHAARSLDSSLLATIFANAQAGNSVVAILAGIVGEWSAGVYPLRVLVPGNVDAQHISNDGAIMVGGYATPFDLAALFLCFGGSVIIATWAENYGTAATDAADFSISSATAALRAGALEIWCDRRILIIGAVSALFELAMYSFVFEWTPAITIEGSAKPPYGEIFSIMMLCCMCGTRIFGIVQNFMDADRSMLTIIVASAAALAVPALFSGFSAFSCLFAFLLFEICVGVSTSSSFSLAYTSF